VRISKRHDLGVDEAKRRVDMISSELHEKFGLAPSWDGDHMHLKGKHLSGRIEVAEQSVEVHLRLGLSLIMFERRIRAGVEEAMAHHLLAP
jgi:putative polyhydroxyalkanoate system protein